MAKRQNPEVPEHLQNLTNQFLQEKISRREFLTRTAAMGLSVSSLAALLAACTQAPQEAPTAEVVEKVVTEEVEKVITATPGPGGGQPVPSSTVAEQVAREKYSGETLNVVWESGLQAQDPINFSGPLFQERTGVEINVIEAGVGSELFSQQLTEHTAGTGAHDVLNLQPSWLYDYVAAGVVAPIDEFIEQYKNQNDFEDMSAIYRGMGTFEGTRYGLFDDGDTLLLYYRQDLFEEYADEFADTVGFELAPPANWQEFDQIARFFTEHESLDIYGAAFGRAETWNWQVFIPHFKANGGRFFDSDSMEPLINGEVGLRTIREMAASNQWMPPGIEDLTAVDTFQEWLAGNYAMTYFWPPLGRWSAGYGTQSEQLAFVPESQVAGSTGYALFPGDITQMAAGFLLSVAANSSKQELAYLFIQWMQSPEISLQRVMLPYALRDPFRISHFESQLFRNQWPSAGEYLDKLQEAGEKASLDIFMPGSQEYQDALDRACTATYAGTDPQEALDRAAEEFNSITERLGRDQQQRFYEQYQQMDGAYPEATLQDAPSNLELYE